VVDRPAAAFGMPQIRDVRAEKEPRPRTKGPAPADLLFLSREQLDASLVDVIEIDGQPPDAPGILFVPWGGACPAPRRRVDGF
jgi:hypothetical protein